MKNLAMIIVLAVLLNSQGMVFAQTTSPGRTHPAKNPYRHAVRLRVRQEIRKIMMDKKSGKITVLQAQALKANIRSIHLEEKAFIRKNQGKDLTASQSQQLNQSLDKMDATN